MAKHRTAETDILAQIPAARAREAKARRAGMRAKAARYDASSGRFVLELTNGCAFMFPAPMVAGLRRATAEQLAAVEVLPGGSGLAWDTIDVDVSVPGLLMSSFGRTQAATELARIAGSATSDAKARSSRANGAKGGRPRKAARK
jgi:hypothetical protein